MSEKQRIDRPWREYPIGTLAHAVMGGHWERKVNGWSWNGTGPSFPTPGGDAVSVTLPTTPASQESAGEARSRLRERAQNEATSIALQQMLRERDKTIATLTAELAEARTEVEKEAAQSKHLAEAMSRKIQELIAAENQCSYYKGQYTRAEQVRKEACEANVKAQAKTLWLENDLAAMQEQRDSLRDECERLREEDEYKDLQYHLLASEEALERIEAAARTYATRYVQDEADDPEVCVCPGQHEHAKELIEALSAIEPIRGSWHLDAAMEAAK